MIKKIYTVVIEDKVGNEEVLTVEGRDEIEAQVIAMDYAELNQWGAGDWEATTSHEGIDIITRQEVEELRKENRE